MKKLEKLNNARFTTLESNQMKKVVGGSGPVDTWTLTEVVVTGTNANPDTGTGAPAGWDHGDPSGNLA